LESLKGVFVNSLFFFGYAYITAYLFVPFFLSRKRYILLLIVFLLSGLIISYLKFIFSDYLFYTAIAAEMSERIRSVDISHILVNTKDMTFIVAIFLIAKFTKDNYHLRMRLRELQDHQIRSEIKLLRNQLHPHVVFNNLNNMYSLALNNSDLVADNLARIKSVLHYYFIEGKAQRVSLRKELKTIENFIGLEKLRYGERLSVEYSIEGILDNRFIVPFVLFSLVENCFEHGCSIDSGDAWIRITVKIEKDSITFHASNSKPKNVMESELPTVNQSLTSTKNKLDLLYPGKHILRIDDRNEMYSLDLKLRF
jgi:LytS/YehU family sensor histidine kinase